MENQRGLGLDLITAFSTIAIAVIGIFLVYSVGYDEKDPKPLFDIKYEHSKQLIFLGVSFLLSLAVFLIDHKFFRSFAFVIYGFNMLLLVLVMIIGPEINGARSWFVIGPVSIQPSELGKIGTILALSSYLSSPKVDLKQIKCLIRAFVIIFIPVLLIILQGDAGTALVYMGLSICLYLGGMSRMLFIGSFLLTAAFILSIVIESNLLISSLLLAGILAFCINLRFEILHYSLLLLSFTSVVIGQIFNYEWLSMILCALTLIFMIIANYKEKQHSFVNLVSLILASSIGLTLAVSTIFYNDNIVQPHQRDRILVWLKPADYYGTAERYNVDKAELAIGSGGWIGQGYLKGNLTNYNFIPEQMTDFIFCSMGEQFGWIGTLLIVSLFTILISRLLFLSQRQQSQFGKFFAWCLCSILLVHFVVNIGMNIGLVPTIGIPLPFVSAGGSSMITFGVLIALMLKFDMERLEMR